MKKPTARINLGADPTLPETPLRRPPNPTKPGETLSRSRGRKGGRGRRPEPSA
jgi:hypothetical protein